MTFVDKPSLAPSSQAIPTTADLDFTAAEATLRTAPDRLVLPRVSEYLARGLALRRWWAEIEKHGGPEETFEIERSFNRPTRSFGFFGEAPVDGKMMPVLGNVQEMFYDQVRVPVGREHSSELTLAQ